MRTILSSAVSTILGKTRINTRMNADAGVHGAAGNDVLFALTSPSTSTGLTAQQSLARNSATYSCTSLAALVDSGGLVRYGPHNYLQKSQELDSAPWAPSGASISANAALSPIGDLTADTVTTLAAGYSGLSQVSGVTTPGTYTMSVWVRVSSGTQTFALDLWESGVADHHSGDYTATTTWQRFEWTVSCPSTGAKAVNLNNTLIGGVKTFEVWGFQLERNITASEYVPTTTAARFDVLRRHYIGGVAKWLMEDVVTNYALWSQAFDNAAWVSLGGTTVAANTTVAPDGTTTADTLTFPGAGSKRFQLVAPNTAGTYSVSVWAKVSSGTRIFRLGITDNGVISNLSANFTATTTWQKFSFSFTTANAVQHGIEIENFSAAGDLIVWQGQFEPGPASSSEIYTEGAAATRAFGSLSVPYTPVPQESTIYCKATNVGGAITPSAVLFSIGNNAATTPYLGQQTIDSTDWRCFHHNGTSQVSGIRTPPAINQSFETRIVLGSDGSIQHNQSINAAAETSSAVSAANAFAGAWSAPTLRIADWTGVVRGNFAFDRFVIAKKTKTLAQMQLLAA